ncbi:MAG: metallophosphoesterase [Lachnospiraceae bacterium]|nr:metallophosphoesterase [Lachnospiraceae bacterium]
MKIGILSDTHGNLPDRFFSELGRCDYIIHAGDIGSEKCYQTLKTLPGSLYMVRGNCDMGRWAAYLPQTLSFLIQGVTFYLIHNLTDLPYPLPEADVIISGHTHAPTAYTRRNTLYLNPGSAGSPRLAPPSILLLTITPAPDVHSSLRYTFIH